MKITNHNVQSVNPYRANQTKTDNVKKQDASLQDRLEISNEAKKLSEPSPITTQRSDKVSALKAQIQAGTYNVDPEKLAKDLIGYFNPEA